MFSSENHYDIRKSSADFSRSAINIFSRYFLVFGVVGLTIYPLQAQFVEGFKLGTKSLASCVEAILASGEPFRGSDEECECLSRLDALDERISELENAYTDWESKMKRHECTRPYLGKEFTRSAPYFQTQSTASKKPGDGEIRSAEQKMQSANELAKSTCQKIKTFSSDKLEQHLKEKAKALQERRKNIQAAVDEDVMRCRTRALRIECISEAIKFYESKKKMDWDEPDRQKRKLETRLKSESEEFGTRCGATGAASSGSSTPSGTQDRSSVSTPSSAPSAEGEESGGKLGNTAVDTAEGGSDVGPYNCGMINEGRDVTDKTFSDWYQKNCTN